MENNNYLSLELLETRELLIYLEKLEIGLSSFSYGELGTSEAVELKKSFESFKHGLKDKVFGPGTMNQRTDLYGTVGIQGPAKTDTKDMGEPDFMSLLGTLENTPLNKEQSEIVNVLKRLAKNPKGSKNLKEPNSSSTKFEYIEKDLSHDCPQHRIGLTSVLEECMGHMDLMEEVVRMFKQNLLEFIGCAKVQLTHGDIAQLGLACQKVIPSLRMMKSHGLLETVQQMAVHCSGDMDRKHLEFLYDQFTMEFPEIQDQVDFEMELLRTM